jgi:nucleotide-binding universal stress UspA family protein
MTLQAIISYDDTQSDFDALALGRTLGHAGAALTLAYVRHTTQRRTDREELEIRDAEALLERGAHRLDSAYIERRVVLSGSTAQGLGWLAAQEQADVIVFGSDYRTGAGHVSVCPSAQTLLQRGGVALAIAPAGYNEGAEREIETIGVLPGSADEAAIETAFSLAERFNATVVDRERGVDLLIVGSRSEAPEGTVMISARSQNAIEEARSPVIVVARCVPLYFDTLVTA